VRLGTYNVLGLTGYPASAARTELRGASSPETAAHFTSVFRSLDCDVLALQEGVGAPQMQRIARELGNGLVTMPSPQAWPGHVLTRYPILESRTYSHMAPGAPLEPFSRCAGEVLLLLPNAESLCLVVVHMHPSDQHMRDAEADLLHEKLPELLTLATHMAVVGDFNCRTDERLHEVLHMHDFVNAMEHAGGGVHATMDTAGIEPQFIDHIYLSASLIPYTKNARVVRDEGFRHDAPLPVGKWVHSDHLPVVVELDLPE
jgi:endonuclease/exonuclease/phosphatase family metal-dependent hydrolase